MAGVTRELKSIHINRDIFTHKRQECHVRTNIEIDDDLMSEAIAASGAPTKKAAVEKALRLLVQLKQQGDAIERLWGTVVWRGPDDDWFASDEEILAKRKLEEMKVADQRASTLSAEAAEVVEETARR
jgi:Arc/MetJ family transcription regulator